MAKTISHKDRSQILMVSDLNESPIIRNKEKKLFFPIFFVTHHHCLKMYRLLHMNIALSLRYG